MLDSQRVELLNNVLNGFNIKAKCVDSKANRHFAFYDVELAPGTRLNQLMRYSKELSIAMRAKTDIIMTPIFEKGIIRLHTTQDSVSSIELNTLYNNCDTPDGMLPFLFGETAEGHPLWVDMATNPHLLVAGSTGSGKSVFLHALIANAAKRDDVQLYLIDTKRVEFNMYSNVGSLVCNIADNYNDAMDILDCVHQMMESRYGYMETSGLQNFGQCSDIFDKVIVIIDEVADLMLYNKTKQFENSLIRLAQKARAAGIYLVLATQRPSVDVITGLIKSNFPARVACKVSTKVDSRVILDQHGAENLAGRGDAILKHPVIGNIRFQVAFVNPSDTVSGFKGNN